MTDRVLVTGATGFIGHHLVPALLERGDQVTCLVRRTSDISALESMGVAFAYGDITQPESLNAPIAAVGTVYHLAAATTARSKAEFTAFNANGTENVARACAAQDTPPTLVVLSSLAAGGPSPADRPRIEADPPAPVSNYGRSKLAGERAARAYASELPLTLVRAPWVFGERDRDTLKIFRMVRYRLLLVPVAPTNRYSLIHAADLAAFLILAAARGERVPPPSSESGEGLYYASSSVKPTYMELGLAISQAMDRRHPRTLRVPEPLVMAIAAVVEGFAMLLRRAPDIVNLDKAREGFSGSWACSSAKAERQLGYAPPPSLESRLRRTARWYQDQGWL